MLLFVINIVHIQEISEDINQVICHHILLLHGAVVLNGEYYGVVRLLEGVLLARGDHVLEEDPGDERVAVVDDGLVVISVPTIN